jgi:DNA-directed RNA polymerase subunit RPC12/RpoP
MDVRCTNQNCKRIIMAYPEGAELPTEKYEITCPHCGTVNRIRQQTVEEVKESHRQSQAEYKIRKHKSGE